MADFLEADGAWYDVFEEDDWDQTAEMPGVDEFYDDIDSGILESLIIIGLAAALGFLVYYRQQRQLEHRRAQEQQQQQQQQDVAANGAPVEEQQQPQEQDRGLFPRPGDPDFNNWVAGGIGH